MKMALIKNGENEYKIYGYTDHIILYKVVNKDLYGITHSYVDGLAIMIEKSVAKAIAQAILDECEDVT
jgi:hypothetical protein